MSKYQNNTAARQFVDWTDRNPQGYADHVRGLTGHDVPTTEMLLRMHGLLREGKALTAGQIDSIAAAFPDVPRAAVRSLCVELNQQHPGQRADLYLGLLCGDQAAVAGRFNEAGAGFKALSGLAREYEKYEMVDTLDYRRAARDGRPVERPAPDPTSVRSIVARAMEHPGARAAADAVERGDEQVIQATKEVMATHLEGAAERLESGEGSLRDTIEAAYMSEAIEAEATDRGWLPADGD